MRIILAVETLTIGGAELFVLRLGRALQAKGHQVLVYNFHEDIQNRKVVRALNNGYQVRHAKIPQDFNVRKLDSLFYKCKLDFVLRDHLLAQDLKRVIAEFRPDVIHSHLFRVDQVILKIQQEEEFKALNHVVTIHGDYITFFQAETGGIKINKLLNYKVKFSRQLAQLKKIVCISEAQLQFFLNYPESEGKLYKIYNGYEVPPFQARSRSELGIGAQDFVFGMVARGIPEKGWLAAIQATLTFLEENPAVHLLLVGESPYLQELAQQYKHSNIHFVGLSLQSAEWIDLFDVGLLPSYYSSESLPTTIIEYMALGKPSIATNIGEIKHMLVSEAHQAGILIDLVDGFPELKALVEAMQRLAQDATLRKELQQGCLNQFKLFDMTFCISSYEALYYS